MPYSYDRLTARPSEELTDPDESSNLRIRSPLEDTPKNAPPTPYVWMLTGIAGVSGLLFGYDTGIISSTLLHLSASLCPPGVELSNLEKSLITSSTSLAALIASPLSGILSDSHGRKPTIYLADLLFLLGAIFQSLSTSVPAMIFGRFLVGLGVGVGSGVIPMYIAELVPAQYRGRMTTLYTGCITLGQVLAYAIGWWTAEETGWFGPGIGWRVGVGLGAVPAIGQALGLRLCPESPRWLVMKERTKEAAEVLTKVLGGEDENLVSQKLAHIEQGVENARNHELSGRGWNKKFLDLWMDKQGRKALLVVCMLQSLQQFCGFNSLMYFSATIFSMIGFTNPTATSMIIASTNLLFTLIAFALIDRVGRRRILLWSIPGMIFGLVFSAIAFSHLDILSPQSSIPHPRSLVSSSPYPILVLLSMTLYVSSYAIGIGTVPWTAQSEVFKMQHRGIGNGISTGVNWAGNFLVGVSFLELLQGVGGEGVFLGYAVICAAGWYGCWRWFSERGGMELEEGDVGSEETAYSWTDGRPRAD